MTFSNQNSIDRSQSYNVNIKNGILMRSQCMIKEELNANMWSSNAVKNAYKFKERSKYPKTYNDNGKI